MPMLPNGREAAASPRLPVFTLAGSRMAVAPIPSGSTISPSAAAVWDAPVPALRLNLNVQERLTAAVEPPTEPPRTLTTSRRSINFGKFQADKHALLVAFKVAVSS